MGNISTAGLIAILCVLTFAVMVYSSFIGAVHLPYGEVWDIWVNKLFGIGDISCYSNSDIAIAWKLYAPRALLGLEVGVGLALVGVVMQAMVQNPLADPYILGISSGASLGATFAILMASEAASIAGAFSGHAVEFWAFIGALGTSFFVFILASIGGRMTSTKLVLSGVIIASLCGSISNLIVYINPNAQGMRDLTFWLMGSLSTVGFGSVEEIAIPLVICILFFATQLRNLNAMMLGDDTATTLGVNLNKLRMIYLVATSVLISVIVCKCGVIGFVGLMIPHIARSIVGTNHWKLMPISILLGAIFMMVADIFARYFTSSEIPIGIITSFCGAPVFAYIMIKKSYGFGGGD
ncbi:MAG: iron ABC transporter permease [Candidatus Methanomethylophilus sp.]|nr:iron ABC transporter permease [Methanomethylophilus sp.]MCI2074200.1 iron ABC transporter permease [Methanomethylophilus sp.]MCI2093003.1 iron ABC transporter permease [Methanomethylophilus sp.]